MYALSTGPGASDLTTVYVACTLDALDILYTSAEHKSGDSPTLSIVREYIGEQTEVHCCCFPVSVDSAEKEAVWDEIAATLIQEVEVGK